MEPNRIKKITAAAFAAAAVMTVYPDTTALAEDADKAMGRYIESELSLPDGMIGYNACAGLLGDGTLRVCGMVEESTDIKVWDLKEGDTSWEEVYTLPEEYRELYPMASAVGADGKVFMCYVKWNERSEIESNTDVVFSREGEAAEPELERKDEEALKYPSQIAFAGEKEILYGDHGSVLRLFNTEDGRQVRDFNENEKEIAYFWTAGNELYIFGYDELTILDMETGEEREEEAIRTEIEGDPANFEMESIEDFPLVMCGGAQEGEVYYCNHNGIFRYMQGGSVVEQIVDGKMTSLARPSVRLHGIYAKEDGTLLVLAADGEDPKLFSYRYDASVQTVPDKELRIYSLYDNKQVQQAASMFQVQHPEYFVNMETGMSGEDSVTTADALRTLNTEIMAGNGPDILVLDGLPVDSYIEKGVLMDLREIYQDAAKTEELLENITGVYAMEESIHAIPTRFKVPILQGKADILAQITDLVSLGATAKNLRSQDEKTRMIVNADTIYWYVKKFYSACSPALVAEDGSFDEQALTEFITQLSEIWKLNRFEEDEVEARYAYTNQEDDLTEDMTTSSYVIEYLAGWSVLSELTLADGQELSKIVSLNDQQEMDYIAAPYCGKNVFIPSAVVGISNAGEQKEAAGEFVKFMLSEEVQLSNQGGGFPVNKKALDQEIPEAGVGIGGLGFSYMDEEGTKQHVDFSYSGPSAKQREKFLSLVESLDTPSFTDTMMEDMIVEQAGKAVAGEISVEEAVSTVSQKMSLYLAE